ncbi:MAG: Rpn family recombination-promoting nuclease/putative transposase [Candidatus Competibacteraceae bacterium]
MSKESFIDEQLRGHYSADMLYHLKRKDGAPVQVYILLEHKRTPERSAPFQLLRYEVKIGERALNEGIDPADLPPVIPVLVYQGDSPWPYGQTFQQSLRLPDAFARYMPEFRYVLCDLSRLSDAEIKGIVWLQVALLLMKHIADPTLAEQLPAIFGLCRELGSKRTALGYLETILRYLSAASKTVGIHDIRRAIATTLPKLEERLMPTIAEEWLEEGKVLGERQMLLNMLQQRFGTVPASYKKRLKEADSDTLLEWGRRLLSAPSLKEVFKQ